MLCISWIALKGEQYQGYGVLYLENLVFDYNQENANNSELFAKNEPDSIAHGGRTKAPLEILSIVIWALSIAPSITPGLYFNSSVFPAAALLLQWRP